MPSLLLLSINNDCTQIQQSHEERLALNICMCVSTRFETQIILIILHEVSFSFPNLALVHALPMACRGLLLYFPVQLFPQKLLTRALAGHCVKSYHALMCAGCSRQSQQLSDSLASNISGGGWQRKPDSANDTRIQVTGTIS